MHALRFAFSLSIASCSSLIAFSSREYCFIAPNTRDTVPLFHFCSSPLLNIAIFPFCACMIARSALLSRAC
jgi:hypothetical protein